MDPVAINYNANATIQAGACNYPKSQTGAFVMLPKSAVPTIPNVKTTIVAKPSTTQFFGGPKKATPKETVQAIKQAVATEKVAIIDTKIIPVSCESDMVSIYQYAIKYELITNDDVPMLCQPISRIRLAELMVNYALMLALIEPDLGKSCTFPDIKSYNNTQKFFATLACDFGFL